MELVIGIEYSCRLVVQSNLSQCFDIAVSYVCVSYTVSWQAVSGSSRLRSLNEVTDEVASVDDIKHYLFMTDTRKSRNTIYLYINTVK